jgi:hypothetical protein
MDEDKTITREEMLELELAGCRDDVNDLREENGRLRLLLKEYRDREKGRSFIEAHQMQEGKRYLVTVEGVHENGWIWDQPEDERKKSKISMPALLSEYGVFSATHIQEIDPIGEDK